MTARVSWTSPTPLGPPSHSTPRRADFNAQFRVVATVPGKTITSNAVKLTQGAVAAPELAIHSAGGAITITFTGTLQSATTVNGTYQNVPGSGQPVCGNPADRNDVLPQRQIARGPTPVVVPERPPPAISRPGSLLPGRIALSGSGGASSRWPGSASGGGRCTGLMPPP